MGSSAVRRVSLSRQLQRVERRTGLPAFEYSLSLLSLVVLYFRGYQVSESWICCFGGDGAAVRAEVNARRVRARRESWLRLRSVIGEEFSNGSMR